jgi:hypothetical protein
LAGVSGPFVHEQEIGMAVSDQGNRIRTGSTGRGFACMDPERQREIVGYVRTTPSRTPLRAAKPASMNWMRVQPDVDAGFDEGSSSRRSR